jgi:hypothetical protein
VYEAQAWRLVRRLARAAGLKSAGQLSPHSLYRTFVYELDDAGVPLQDIQDAMGHADPRSTRSYMATHQHLDRHATYAFAAWLRRRPTDEAAEDQRSGPGKALTPRLARPAAPCHGCRPDRTRHASGHSSTSSAIQLLPARSRGRARQTRSIALRSGAGTSSMKPAIAPIAARNLVKIAADLTNVGSRPQHRELAESRPGVP